MVAFYRRLTKLNQCREWMRPVCTSATLTSNMGTFRWLWFAQIFEVVPISSKRCLENTSGAVVANGN